MPVVPISGCDSQNVSRDWQMLPRLRTTNLGGFIEIIHQKLKIACSTESIFFADMETEFWMSLTTCLRSHIYVIAKLGKELMSLLSV